MQQQLKISMSFTAFYEQEDYFGFKDFFHNWKKILLIRPIPIYCVPIKFQKAWKEFHI